MADHHRKIPLAACPDSETIAAYIDGRLSGRDRQAMTGHLADCEDCYVLFSESVRTHSSDVTQPRVLRPWHAVAAATAGLAAAASLTFVVQPQLAPRWWPGRSDVADLVAAVGHERTIEPRLTEGFAYGPLVQQTIMRSGARPEDALSPEIRMSVIALEKRLQDDRSPSVLHAYGAAQLVTWRADTAVSALEEAVRLEPNDARYQSDLAAAYLVRCKQKNDLEDASRAVRAATTATQLAPSLAEAHFNLALALEALSRREDARTAWNAYLAIDSKSPWGQEAKQHLDAFAEIRRPEIR